MSLSKTLSSDVCRAKSLSDMKASLSSTNISDGGSFTSTMD